MTAVGANALSLALKLLKQPAGLAEARSARFPDGITTLLRLVTVDVGTIEQAVAQSGQSEAVLRDAAEFYVLQVCFTPGIDSYRVLGANRDDPTTRLREHYRLLVRWLHPDRNSDAWQTVFLDRVNRAWRDLRGEHERAEYDRLILPAADAGEANHLVAGMPRTVVGAVPHHAMGKWVSARTMRRLPGIVLGALGVAAATILALLYLTKDEDLRNALPVSVEAGASHASERLASPSRTREMLPAAGRVAREVDPGSGAGAVSAQSSLPIAPIVPDATDVFIDHDATGVVATPADGRESTASLAKTSTDDAPAARRSLSVSAAEPVAMAAPQPSSIVAEVAEVAEVAAPAPGSASVNKAAKIDELKPAAAATGVLAAAPAETPSAPVNSDQRVVDALLEEFKDAYDQGDLIRLMALFTRDARNMAQGSKLLADDYRELFESSRKRHLLLRDMSWWREGDMVAVVATFDASVTPIGRAGARHIAGDIRFELRREDGAVRIARIRHQTQ